MWRRQCPDRSIRRLAFLAMLTLGLIFPLTAGACVWDFDTLNQERSQFPKELELITGKFPRHTKEFYEWRVRDRQKTIAATGVTPELLDDLAVAFDKLGDQTQAIATMERAELLFPGRYKTAANLGTFYFHAKQFEAGIPHIERALQIDPEAHFGREKYQLLLVKYLLSKQVDGITKLPLSEINQSGDPVHQGSFRHFVLQGLNPDHQPWENERAIQGILGMMRFGKHDSAILLEALGDLLYSGHGDASNSQQLAARAYLQASYVTRDQPDVSAAYRQRAAAVLVMHLSGTGNDGELLLKNLEPLFQEELADAKAWFQTLTQNEHEWIINDPNPEFRFTSMYYVVPGISEHDENWWTTVKSSGFNLQSLAVAMLAIIGLGLVACILLRRWLIDHNKTLTDTLDVKDLFR